MNAGPNKAVWAISGAGLARRGAVGAAAGLVGSALLVRSLVTLPPRR
jgi:hypothetical protein